MTSNEPWMLTLTALEEGDGLRIRTEVVEVPVWKLPLPELPGAEPQYLGLAEKRRSSPAQLVSSVFAR